MDPKSWEVGYYKKDDGTPETVGPYEFLDTVSDIFFSDWFTDQVDEEWYADVEDWDDLRGDAADWYKLQLPRAWHDEAARDMAHDYLAFDAAVRRFNFLKGDTNGLADR